MPRSTPKRAVLDILYVSHNKESTSPEETLNRVFQKGLTRSGVPLEGRPERFSSADMTVHLEIVPIKDILPLVTRSDVELVKKKTSKKVRHFPDDPVIVCEYAGVRYLVDGNRRVVYLHEIGRSEVKVYICRIS